MAKNNPEAKSDFIPLKEAADYCDYSQEYLGLRARQGKLKAVKFGRNWVTKKKWIEEYVQGIEKLERREIEPERAKMEIEERQPRPVEPMSPRIEERRFKPVESIRLVERTSPSRFKPVLKPALGLSLAFVLLFSGLFLGGGKTFVLNRVEEMVLGLGKVQEFGKDSLNKGGKFTVTQLPDTSYQNLREPIGIFKEYFKWLAGNLKPAFVSMPKTITGGAKEGISSLGQSLKLFAQDTQESANNLYLGIEGYTSKTFGKLRRQFSALNFKPSAIVTQTLNNLKDGLDSLVLRFVIEIEGAGRIVRESLRLPLVQLRKKEIETKPILPKSTGTGMVVIPSTLKDEEAKEKIKRAFSDEVIVEPEDERTGVIKPVFREGTGGEYMYILVPIVEE